MNRMYSAIVVLLLVSILLCGSVETQGNVEGSVPVPQSPAMLVQAQVLGNAPVYFVENGGQVDDPVAYLVHGEDKTLYFEPGCVTFALSGEDEQGNYSRWAVKLEFLGANPDSALTGKDETSARFSYFRGRPEQWRTGLRTYSTVVYHDLWRGIDLEYSGKVNHLKYRFLVHPGADPGQIRLLYRGASALTVNTDGQIEVSTPVGSLYDDSPVAYQEVSEGILPVEVDFVLEGGSVGFSIGPYDCTRTLVLDPAILVYGGFIGGSGEEYGRSISVHKQTGAAYICGETSSTNVTFSATPGPYEESGGGYDAFVAKVSPSGMSLEYCCFIGGEGKEIGYSVAVDDSGNAYFCGATFSAPDQSGGFPVVGGSDRLRTYSGNGDAFVAKLDPGGTSLDYCWYIGGTDGGEDALDIAVDAEGCAYVTGRTQSSQDDEHGNGEHFPVKVGPDLSYGGGYDDAFVAKVAADGTDLVYCGYIGGTDGEVATGIHVDDSGNAYVVGRTESDSGPEGFPASGPLGVFNGGWADGFLAKIASEGDRLDYCIYIGASGWDTTNGVYANDAGDVWVSGHTGSSSGFPMVVGPSLVYLGGTQDGYVARIAPDGNSFVYCGYIGGSGADTVGKIVVDSEERAYVIGRTNSADFQSENSADSPLDTYHGGEDAFVAVIDHSGSGVLYHGYIGGSGYDVDGGIDIDRHGAAYITGATHSVDFPTTVGAHDTSYNGGADAFVVKVEVGGARPDTTARGTLQLLMPGGLAGEPVAGAVRIHNPGAAAQMYALSVELKHDGVVLESDTQDIVVAAGATIQRGFDFGTQETGVYEIVAGLSANVSSLASVASAVTVFSSRDQHLALRAGGLLGLAALGEYGEAQHIVATARADSVAGLEGEALGLVLGLVDKVGEALKLTEIAAAVVVRDVTLEVMNIEEMIKEGWDYYAKYYAKTEVYISAQRQAIDARYQEYYDKVVAQESPWNDSMPWFCSNYKELIRSRVEQQAIDPGLRSPPFPIGETTLAEEKEAMVSWHKVRGYLGWLAIGLAVVLLILAIVGSGGAVLAVVIPALKGIIVFLKGVTFVTALFLLMASMSMDKHLETIVAPAITEYHGYGLDELEHLIEGTGSLSTAEVQLQAEVQGTRATLVSLVGSLGKSGAVPMVQTNIYSADGRLIEMLSSHPALVSGKTTLRGTLVLRPGRYRAVTSVHTSSQLGLANDVTVFQVERPQVQASIHIAQPQLAISQTLEMSVTVTNTDSITGTGDLALVVESSDGENGDVWLINLPAGGNDRFDLSFVPPGAGSYALRAQVIGAAGDLLALRETGYVVGSGPALAVEASCAPEWDPGVQVTAYITVTNAGNESASASLDVVTVDLAGGQAVYTTTIPLNLPPGGQHSEEVMGLTNAQPGRYAVNLVLDGGSYFSLPLVVASDDRLLVIVQPDRYTLDLGEAVTLTVGVLNTTYDATDANVSGTLIDPTFTSYPLSVTRVHTGTYQANYTPVLSGTHQVVVTAEKANWRGDEDITTFIVESYSQLIPEVVGNPKVGETGLITFTVRNDRDFPVPGASVFLSGTAQLLYGATDDSGVATICVAPPDTLSYDVRVEKDGHASTATALDVDPIETYLSVGWNLISYRLSPASTVITDVLSSIEGQYDLVYAYHASDVADPWKKYNTAAPSFLNDLTDIDETIGLWIRATEPVTLTVSGSVPSSTDISLYTGWNLVGYPSQTTRAVTEALASIEGKYDLVYAYDAWDAADPWKKYNTAAPPFLNDLTEMGPGWGYWIRVSEDCVWSVP